MRLAAAARVRFDKAMILSSTILAVVASVAVLPACTSAPVGATTSSAASGPWAAELDELREDSPSDIQQAVLADGVIAESEVAELEDRTEKCLEDKGYDIVWQPEGGASITAPVGSNLEGDRAIMNACEEPNIGAIRDFAIGMKRNPQNLSEDAILAACLVAKGAVDPNFTAEDMARAGDDDSALPWKESDPAVSECFSDPLDLLG